MLGSPDETKPGAFPERPREDSGDFVCNLIDLQPELRTFIAHLMPFADVRGDILQDVNLLVWEKRENFELGTNFRAWVYTFARNVTMQHQKRARRENERVFSQETIDLLADEFSETDPVIDDRMVALRSCLEKIPNAERKLLLSRYAERGAVEKAAETSDKSASALRGTLFRLRTALRRCVENEMRTPFGGAA